MYLFVCEFLYIKQHENRLTILHHNIVITINISMVLEFANIIWLWRFTLINFYRKSKSKILMVRINEHQLILDDYL